MSLISIVVALIVVGIVLYCINAFVPMEASIKKILNIVVICVVVLWLIKGLGLFSYFSTIHT